MIWWQGSSSVASCHFPHWKCCFPGPGYLSVSWGHLLGGSTHAHSPSWVLATGNEGMFEKSDTRENKTQPLPLRLTLPPTHIHTFVLYCLLGGGEREVHSFLIFLPSHRLLGRTLFSLYLPINKLKGRSCLFPEIKNCTHNYPLSSWTSSPSVLFVFHGVSVR